jgi:hypothetical protein
MQRNTYEKKISGEFTSICGGSLEQKEKNYDKNSATYTIHKYDNTYSIQEFTWLL